jgi:hypothetical protein
MPISELDLTGLGEKLDQLISLVAANLVKGMKPNDAIIFLGRTGLDRTLIADLVGRGRAFLHGRIESTRNQSFYQARMPRLQKRRPYYLV